MNPTFLGFDITPYAVIIWYKGEEAHHRTFCSDEQEIQLMLERHQTEGDFYSQYDVAKVFYTVPRERIIA